MIDAAVAPLHRPGCRPPSATDRLTGGIERARAVNTRRETGARSCHKGLRHRTSHLLPSREYHTYASPERRDRQSRGYDQTVSVRRSFARRVQLKRLLRICLANAHRPTDRPQLRAGLKWELTANQTRRGPFTSTNLRRHPSPVIGRKLTRRYAANLLTSFSIACLLQECRLLTTT